MCCCLPVKDNGTKKIDNMETIKGYLPYLRGLGYTGDKPAVIDFYATWCGPCQSLMPLVGRLAEDYHGRLKVIKVDVDVNSGFAQAANIFSVPTLFFVDKDGNIERSVGAKPYHYLCAMADELVKS